MNSNVKATWIKALRSGEYEQTIATLRNKKGFCCLGVLADCFVKEYPEIAEWRFNELIGCHEIVFSSDGNGYSGFLPACQSFRDWIGNLETAIEWKLADVNDSKNFTFSQIADWIEQNL